MALGDAFKDMAEARERKYPLSEEAKARIVAAQQKRWGEAKAKSKGSTRPLPAKKLAKSRNPDYDKKTVYVRHELAVKALRKYQDVGVGTEFSDLVEMVLQKYVSG